ncbi:MAG: hypothetical protein ACYC09_08575 [Bacteroidota bacterium]
MPIHHSSFTVFSLLLFPFTLSAQTDSPDTLWLNDDWYYTADSPSFIDLTKFLPAFFRDEALLKRYLRDDRFYDLRKRYDDTLAVDAIYDRAMLIADGDIEHALLISTVAVMDHRRLGLRLPIVGAVWFPLTFEGDSLFRLRRTHLPKKVLDDRPRASDKDKLQHFFGSAYIAYSTNSETAARWVGDLMEKGEDTFVLGGRDDVRDRLANERGRSFGLGLLYNPTLLPSDVLWP